MTKHLIFITEVTYPYRVGGAEVFNHYLMRSFVDACKVSTINTKMDKKQDGVNYIKIAPPFLGILFFPLLTAIKLLRLSRKSELHVVLTFSRSRWIYWMVYPLLRNLFNIRYTIIIHGGGLMKWKFAAPFQWFFKRADQVIGISKPITNEYRKRTGIEVKFIPPLIPFTLSDKSVQEARQQFGIDADAKVLLMVGSIIPLKHPETALQALAALGSEFLEAEKLMLVFAGDGPDRKSLELQSVKLGVDKHVMFLGNVYREEIKHVYRSSDYYIIASDFEGVPLAMLEAMANNLPVLASNAPGINAIIKDGENGQLFTIGSDNELAAHLKTLLGNEHLAKELAANAHQTFIQQYSHQNMLNTYRKLWNI